jgi:hypothetical protein
VEHPVQALESLPEHALRPVAVLLELDPGFFLHFPPPLVAQREGHGQDAPDERHRPLSDDSEHKHQETAQAGFGQTEMRFEMFAESLHAGFGGSGIVRQVFHSQRLTPRSAIC